jgi:hypothetical protein
VGWKRRRSRRTREFEKIFTTEARREREKALKKEHVSCIRESGAIPLRNPASDSANLCGKFLLNFKII